MVTELRIYFEGDRKLKPGFHEFFKEIREIARSKRCRFQTIATGGTPLQDFQDGLASNPEAWNVLLLDSDMPMDVSHADLCRRKRIDTSHEGSVFWMVQIMESWFLGDVDALKRYYGAGFDENVLKGSPRIEEIRKADVLSRLKRATKATKPGEYHKTKHAPDLLATIEPNLVRGAAPNCERMFRVILTALAGP